MLNFENRLINMIENIKFRNNKCRFQTKLSSDVINYTKNSNELLVPADKTTNFYKMNESSYNELLHKNITKTHKKVSPTVASAIEKKTKSLVQKLNLDDRINVTAKRDAFITLKDHKPNFLTLLAALSTPQNLKSVKLASKSLIELINKNVITNLKLNQWKNTSAVLEWFNNIENKSQYSFIAFDVVDFYPSISIDLLTAASDFASSYDNITDDERQIIIHAKQSCLFHSGEQWAKKSSSNLFDITMGSYGGAESCELVGSFLLHLITQKYGKNFGLYRDDGLGIIKGSPRQVELTKKHLCEIFNDHGLKITIEADKKCVDFLDVTLNLTTGKHMPYTKPNNTPLYIHTKSNHPPVIIKNIPESINKRLSDISSDKESFDRAAIPYQRALEHSGYNYKLKFQLSTSPSNTSQRQKRQRNITWYNPPYSKNVATNIGKTFLQILDEEFHENHVLHKIFNRNTVKISYACMPNIKQTIDGHNKSILLKSDKPKNDECNCRKTDECPLLGQCLKKSVVYQATVTCTNHNKPDETYVGLTSNTFKTRFTNHKNSFKYRKKKHSTELSNYIWQLKDNNIDIGKY